MLDPTHLYTFTTASLVLIITPGPAVLYIIARSIHQGKLAGIMSVLGLELGTLFHVIGSALGLSALLLSSAIAFHLVKYLGAAYLIYLGIQKLLTSTELPSQQRLSHQNLSHIFWQGMVVNILNPKTALFFFAFLPQFIDPDAGNITQQMLLLELICGASNGQ